MPADGLKLPCFHKGQNETADTQKGVQSTVVVQQWTWRRGLRVPTALSPSGEGVRVCTPWAASRAGEARGPGSEHLSHSWVFVK